MMCSILLELLEGLFNQGRMQVAATAANAVPQNGSH